MNIIDRLEKIKKSVQWSIGGDAQLKVISIINSNILEVKEEENNNILPQPDPSVRS
jgi:hypothetical protein